MSSGRNTTQRNHDRSRPPANTEEATYIDLRSHTTDRLLDALTAKTRQLELAGQRIEQLEDDLADAHRQLHTLNPN